METEELARFYFQDGLSKFCPTEHDRPNTFEKEMFRYGVEHVKKELESVQKENEELKESLEVERIRLAACGVAALSNTRESADNRIDKSNPYYSASYSDVCSIVDREMNLREENARLREALEDIVHCIYGNEATFQWVEKKAREALKGGE